jgi:O-antigen biosynthesis protein
VDNSIKVRAAGKILRNLRFILRPIKNAYRSYLDLSVRRTYHKWAVHNELDCFVNDSLHEDALVSIVVPVFNTDKEHLREMIYSVVNQHYQNWELILVNASSNPESRQDAESSTQIDTRIKTVTPEKNLGISANTNLGIEAAQGEFIAFLDHDDLLHPCALHASMVLQTDQGADLIYSDEDKINHDGNYFFGPHCKADWSPSLLENLNYINHFTIIRSKFVKGLDGLRPECDGAQDYDFLWRVIDEYNPHIAHVPRVLYHWRAAQSSTAHDISTKTYIFKAGKKALQDHLDRKNIPATAEIIHSKPGFYKVNYKKPDGVSIVIGEVEKMRRPACVTWLKSLLENYDEKQVELLIGDWFEPYRQKFSFKNIQTIKASDPEDHFKQAAKRAKHETLVVFEEAATPKKKDSLFELASAALHSGADAVQPMVLEFDGTIYDAGLVDAEYGYQPLFKGLKFGRNTFFGDTDWVRNVSAVGGTVYATTKSKLARLKDGDAKSRPAAVVWTYALFERESLLRTSSLKTFNPLLDQTLNGIRTRNSSWSPDEGRSE